MRAIGLLAVLLMAGCRPSGTGAVVVDAALAKLVPPDSTMLASIRMDEIRATPLFGTLKELDTKKDVSELLIASNGKDVVTLARFRDGTTTPARSGGIPAALREQMKSIATPNQVWVVSLGWNPAVDAAIPQSGNLSNLRRIYRMLDSITMAADLRSGLDLTATGTCTSDQTAKELADALQTFVSLGQLTARVEQNGPSIRVTAHIPEDVLDRFIRSSGSRKESPPPHHP